MKIEFSQEDIDDIVFWRDHNGWTFAQIAAYKGIAGHEKEVKRTYENNSTVWAQQSRFNRKEFVRGRIWSMFEAANQRREIAMDAEAKKKLKPIVEDMIKPLSERPDLDLCINLWQANDSSNWYTPSLDHIIPVAKGGTDDISNLQWLPRFMNIWKLTESQADWIHFCRQAPEFFIKLSRLYDSGDFDLT